MHSLFLNKLKLFRVVQVLEKSTQEIENGRLHVVRQSAQRWPTRAREIHDGYLHKARQRHPRRPSPRCTSGRAEIVISTSHARALPDGRFHGTCKSAPR